MFNCPICGSEYEKLLSDQLADQPDRFALVRLIINDQGKLEQDHKTSLVLNAFHCPKCGHLSLHAEKTLEKFLNEAKYRQR